MSPRRLLLPALVVLLGAALVPAAAARPEPILSSAPVGDPSVAKVGKTYVVLATGVRVPRAHKVPGRRWRWSKPALTRLPAWARRGDIWAADLAPAGGRWVLYYSAPVRGLGKYGRCIGIAVAQRPLLPFRPIGRRPLVCPKRADVPTAHDPVRAPGLPRSGAIDPSVLVDRGQRYLLYKTDGIPSSIRLLPLSRDGLRVARTADPAQPSLELVRSGGVIENPVVIRREADYYLFASEGDYSRCSYHQTWRRSTDLLSWAEAPPTALLTRRLTGGLCGPAGGDLLVEGGRTTLYFHGWVRRGTTRPPGPRFWAFHRGPRAQRAMYAARLAFPGGVPTVRRYLGG